MLTKWWRGLVGRVRGIFTHEYFLFIDGNTEIYLCHTLISKSAILLTILIAHIFSNNTHFLVN